MGDMKKPSVARSRIVALSLAAAAVAFAPAASYAQDAQDKPSPFGGIGKFFGDIAKGAKEGVKEALGGKDVGEKIADGVKDGLAGKTPQVVGHVELGGGSYVTYFEGSKQGFSSRGAPLSAPPKAGTVADITLVMQTGKFKGKLVDNNIDKMKEMGVLVTKPYLPPGGAVPPQLEARATVPVHTYTDPATGQIWSNAPDNCKIINVSDAKGNLIKQRYLSRNEDYDLAAACLAAQSAKTRQGIKPADGAVRPTTTPAGRKSVGSATVDPNEG